jgi:predicted DNA-binding protein (UPF0251 family)
MFRIMKNAWIDEVRSRIRRDQLFAPEEAGEHVGDDFAEAHQQRIAIQKAISMLSDDHRIVIGLVLVDGLPYKEAAEVLEVPMGTLTSRLARAREALQGLLSDQARTVCMSFSEETLMAYADGELDEPPAPRWSGPCARPGAGRARAPAPGAAQRRVRAFARWLDERCRSGSSQP